MGVSVRQQKRDGKWYVWIRYKGVRAAQKCVDEQHALDTQKAVLTAMASRQFDISAYVKKQEPEPAAKERSAPTLAAFYSDEMVRLWEATVTDGTLKRYGSSYRIHIEPALGNVPLDELTRDRVRNFVIELTRKH